MEAKETTYPVGALGRLYHDPQRPSWTNEGPRPVSALVWYPASGAIRAREQTIAVFRTGRYQWNAPWCPAPARFPLVVVSHGTGGSAASLGWLATRLAEAGFVVAAVNHHGNTGAEPRSLLEGTLLWWERPDDLGVLIDGLLADPEVGPRIDPLRIGVVGFSLGGYTALAAVGARLAMDRWHPYCQDHPGDPICHLPPESPYRNVDLWDALGHNPRVLASWPRAHLSHRDPRIRAAFVLAPVGAPLVTDESLAAITTPVALIVGGEDVQAVPATNAVVYARAIAHSTLEVLSGVGHYAFLGEGTWPRRLFAGPYLRDPRGVNRRAVHELVGERAVAFLDKSLGTKES